MSTVYKINAAADEFTLAAEQFHQVVNALRSSDALNLEHGEVEAWLHSEGVELLRRLLQGHLDVRPSMNSAWNRARVQMVSSAGRSGWVASEGL